MKKRLKALEAKIAQDGLVLEPARRAREGQGREGGAWRVRERVSRLLRRPGHLLCRHHEGGGRIYQQTFIDTYAKPSPSSMIARPRSPRPISSTTVWCPFTISTRSGSAAC